MSDLEEFRPIPGYEGQFEVSNHGRVRSVARSLVKPRKNVAGGFYTTLVSERILSPGINSDGYRTVVLNGKSRNVAHLVAAAFIGPRPPRKVVCHCDGARTNDRPENLRYDNIRGNRLDMQLHGTEPYGERHPFSKLTATDVVDIRRLRDLSSRADLASRYGVTRPTIRSIQLHRTWKHVP